MNNLITILSEYIIPGSSKYNFEDYINKKNLITPEIKNFLDEFRSYLIENKYNLSSPYSQKSCDLINKFVKKRYRKFNNIVLMITECAYMNQDFRAKLNVPLNSSFPDGNILEEFDLELLEEVYNKGPNFRHI